MDGLTGWDEGRMGRSGVEGPWVGTEKWRKCEEHGRMGRDYGSLKGIGSEKGNRDVWA